MGFFILRLRITRGQSMHEQAWRFGITSGRRALGRAPIGVWPCGATGCIWRRGTITSFLWMPLRVGSGGTNKSQTSDKGIIPRLLLLSSAITCLWAWAAISLMFPPGWSRVILRRVTFNGSGTPRRVRASLDPRHGPMLTQWNGAVACRGYLPHTIPSLILFMCRPAIHSL